MMFYISFESLRCLGCIDGAEVGFNGNVGFASSTTHSLASELVDGDVDIGVKEVLEPQFQFFDYVVEFVRQVLGYH